MEKATVFDLTNPQMFADGVPHHVFDELREHEPLYGQPNPLGGTIWSFTRHADVRTASADFKTFCSGNGIVFPNHPERLQRLRQNLMFNDPPVHTRLRGFAAKAFSPAVVARFEDWVRMLCVEIADEVSRLDGKFDAIPRIAAALPAQVISTILGVPKEDRARLVRLIMLSFGEFDPTIGPQESANAQRETQRYAMELREIKRKNPDVDMISQLAIPDPADPHPLDDVEYAQLVAVLMAAGFETTHTLISQTLTLMSEDDAIYDALNTSDRRVLSRGVDELLRFVTPAMYFGRTVVNDVAMHGRQMAKGDFVMLWFAAANRDPAVFENPHRFDINRNAKKHLSFGGGSPHFCIGNHLARLEVELLLQEFAKRGLRLKLAGKPARLPGIMINGLRTLPMRVAV